MTIFNPIYLSTYWGLSKLTVIMQTIFSQTFVNCKLFYFGANRNARFQGPDRQYVGNGSGPIMRQNCLNRCTIVLTTNGITMTQQVGFSAHKLSVKWLTHGPYVITFSILILFENADTHWIVIYFCRTKIQLTLVSLSASRSLYIKLPKISWLTSIRNAGIFLNGKWWH